MNGWLDGLLKTIQERGSVTDLFGQRQQLLSECKSERGKEGEGGGNREHFDELGGESEPLAAGYCEGFSVRLSCDLCARIKDAPHASS